MFTLNFLLNQNKYVVLVNANMFVHVSWAKLKF